MGLAERRRIAAIKDDTSNATTLLKEAIGFELPIEFDTTSLTEDPLVLDGYDYYKDYGLPMVIRIFADICRDDMGKEAVKEKINAIKIVNTSKNGNETGDRDMSLENGLLLVKSAFHYYSGNVWSESDLKGKIENLL